jgi:pyridoxal phosphate enzyme (YggS family)
MIAENLKLLLAEIPQHVKLIAVSKTKPIKDILEAYHAGQRCFGENKVQEMVQKYEQLPKDIEWHLIGHLQSNKVKYIAPFVGMIHSVDGLKLLETINKEAVKNNRKIKCLLQIFIATEESKFGLDDQELNHVIQCINGKQFENIEICGLMGMASFTGDESQIEMEFQHLASLFQQLKATQFYNNPNFNFLSMGMSGDYKIAIKSGANMIRIGSDIFGQR